ncbi:hypothetical protein [Nocardia terpenica]|uniref:Asp23/Gls24 family envelope stress response protein n=1 Tax=Nocardia terpenica TaxID=455432 RepID=A0A164JGG0_9NOCA|nr:hypothetical protein [Nocardia terpenica]KZM70379.1 hypothetical protein AWN90_03595 [Nocardia terpenica]NQE91059.1 Asp23/Gls24 family envelope stress response protein [Nocardia terpenica]
MTSTVTALAPAPPLPDSPAAADAEAAGRIAADAAREITGVAAGVRARVKVTGGAATVTLHLPIRYPMPIWQVVTVCREQVLARLRDRLALPVRRLHIEVSDLPRRAR